jgi:cytosine/adenosine deaminase-related metal-dependent hydrolase
MILSGRWVIPVSSPVLENGAIVVEGDHIADLGPVQTIRGKYPHHPLRDFPDSVLLPGLVNVHSHLELTVLRGYLEGMDFWSWIRTLTRVKYELLSREDLSHSALLGAVEAIHAGITTVGDPMDIGVSLEAVLMAGLRGVLYQEVFSPKPEEADWALGSLQKKLQELEARTRYWSERQRKVTLGVSPHAPYTVSGPLFQKVCAFARSNDLSVCIHLAESEPESQLLRDGTGPIQDSYRQRGIDWNPPCCTPVEYLHQLEILGPSVLLVHCIRLCPSDYTILRDHGVSVAHCPKSNWRLGHGFMNLREMRRHGILLGLGSDSVASNNAMDFFEEMRFALANPTLSERPLSDTPTPFSASDALRLATLGGAEALRLSGEIGSLDAGKQADIIAVDLSKPHLLPVFSPVDTLVYSARASDVHFVMVAGEVLLDEGRMPTVSEPPLYSQIQKIREKLLKARSLN